MKRIFVLFLVAAFFSGLSFCQPYIDQVFTENLTNPIGLDCQTPRFTWIIKSADRQVMQSAYELRVGISKDLAKETKSIAWESGRIDSENSVYVKYNGDDLLAGTRYFWQVRIWDNKRNVSDWSDIAWFQTGLMSHQGWKAAWISAEPVDNINAYYFRKDFRTDGSKKILKASAYITAKGMYEASINGKRMGDLFFTPGWTSYNNRIQYQVYDLTTVLNSGENTFGIILGEGWYKGRISRKHYGSELAVIAQLYIEYEDGSSELIITDDSWKTTNGPIIISDIYDGEIYDSSLEMPGWNNRGYDDSSWSLAELKNFSKKEIISSDSEPVRKQEQLKPIDIFETPRGEKVIDFGQNLVGWVKLKINGAKGDTIILSHAEVLDKDGNFYTENLRGAKARNIYILNGEDQEFEPHFTWQGFRYVKVEGLLDMPEAENFLACALYSDMEQSGKFSTSNDDINQLQQNILWGQKGNFIDVPTDCPQRDERLGWTGDAQAFASTAAYNMHVHNFFAKWLKDLAADQFEDGNVPVVIPHVLGKSTAGSAGWSDAATIVPWNIYQAYGDIKILEDQYASMKAWVDYLVEISNDLLRNNGFHFGDWLFYSQDDDNGGRSAVTDKSLMAQCFFANSARIVASAAGILGKKEDHDFYSQLLTDIKSVFFKEFVTPNGQLVSNTQTAYVLALYFDMLPEEFREVAAERLVKSINDYGHITTGFLGTPYINHVLTSEGYLDTAYMLLLRDKYPSWLYPVRKGATTIWERWNGIKTDGTFQYPSMNSFNHYAYGAIGDWMYKVVAGINPTKPGYKEFIIKPQPGGGISSACGELNTYYGLIKSDWKIEDDIFMINIEVPVNTSAAVYLPALSIDQVEESGLNKKEMMKMDYFVNDDYLVLKIASGSYHFRLKY